MMTIKVGSGQALAGKQLAVAHEWPIFESKCLVVHGRRVRLIDRSGRAVAHGQLRGALELSQLLIVKLVAVHRPVGYRTDR